MKKISYLSVLVLAAMLLVTLHSAFAQSYVVPLKLEDASGNPLSFPTTLYFGVHSSAQDCLTPVDNFFGHAEDPQPPFFPPDGWGGGTLINPGTINPLCYSLIDGSPVDYRFLGGANQLDTFKVQMQTASPVATTRLSWPSGLSANATMMKIVDVPTGGVLINVNMLAALPDTFYNLNSVDYTSFLVIVQSIGTPPVPNKFLTVVPDTIIAKDPIKGKLLKPVKRVKPGKPILTGPNWANLFDETVAQGGFQPGATESDTAGGMVMGNPYMFNKGGAGPLQKWAAKKIVKDTAWVRMTAWDFKKSIGKNFADMQKTLEDKTGKHLNYARGLDSTLNPGDIKRKALKGQLTKMLPGKGQNKLFAELLALKFNIAASEMGKTPEGFGDLVYDMNSNPYDEMSIMDISAASNAMMTFWQGHTQAEMDTLYNTVYRINRAFVGPLDTATFYTGTHLTLKGAIDLATVSFLKLGARPATRLVPTTNETESLEDFDQDAAFEDGDAAPVAAKLYQNYPNPFNPTTQVAFRLFGTSLVTVKVYDILGREVATLLNGEEMEEGFQTASFNASNLASGVYFYQITAENVDTGLKTQNLMGKMLLVK